MNQTKKKRKKRIKKSTKKQIKLSLYIALAAILIIFIQAFITSESDKFSSKLSDAFQETVITLNFTATDYSQVGIISPNLKLSKIQEGYPKIDTKYDEIETYSGFHLSYNEKHEQANWVAYILTKRKVRNDKVDRTNNFRCDKNISSTSAELSDYKASGYDRGHLAPAADMHWSKKSMSESFLMSNMSPQEEAFNRGIWKELEGQIRDFAVENKRIYVITGPVFKQNKNPIGDNKVTVPGYYYKAVLDISPPAYKSIAFLLKNEKSDKDLESFAMSIDQLEEFSGIDFFYYVSDSTINQIEANFKISDWNF